MKSFLPLLDRLRPIDEGGDDMESGAVGALPDVAADAGGGPENADVLAALAMIDDIATAFLKALAPFVAQLANGVFRRQSAEPLIQKRYCLGITSTKRRLSPRRWHHERGTGTPRRGIRRRHPRHVQGVRAASIRSLINSGRDGGHATALPSAGHGILHVLCAWIHNRHSGCARQ
jgi:hypothetical protein